MGETEKVTFISDHLDASAKSNTISYTSLSSNYSYDSQVRKSELDMSASIEDVDGENMMNNDDMLKMYITKVDQDRADLKSDVVESERRTEAHIKESEQRTEDRMKRIEEMYIQQNQKLDSISDKVTSGLNEYRNFLWGITITILVAAVTLVVTIIIK